MPPPKPPGVVLPQNGSSPVIAQPEYSLLWGKGGELWRPTSRVADASYVGYMGNDAFIPNYPAQFNVVDFGARGDGIADDTGPLMAAIKAASDAAYLLTTVDCGSTAVPRRCPALSNGMGNEGLRGVAVLLPPGRYKLTQTIEITQSNVVVRGAGVDKTVLYFPKPLQDVYGDVMEWSYMGGFLTISGEHYDSRNQEFKLAKLTSNAAKGDRRLQVSSAAGIKVGQWIRLFAAKQDAIGRRKLLQEQRLRGSTARRQQHRPTSPLRRQLLASDTAAAGGADSKAEVAVAATAASQTRLLPLTPGLLEGKRQAEELGLAEEAHSSTAALSRGDKVDAYMAHGTLDAYLYGDNAADSGSRPFPDIERIRFVSRVAAAGDGWIELERPLLYDLRLEWQVGVYSFQAAVQHSGYEAFTVEFKWDVYPQHLNASGYNGFYCYGVANSWIRNIRILDADTGGEFINTDFMTMQNITLEFTKPRGTPQTQNCDGHHGLWAAASSNVLITGFDFKGKFIHDLTLDVFSQECAYVNGKGVDMSLDMHRSGVHNNLWSNINVGLGLRPFASSGNQARGAHAAANNTWWNIHSDKVAELALPACNFGPLLTFVGSYGSPGTGPIDIVPSALGSPDRFPGYCTSGVQWWVERRGAEANSLDPADLYSAMLATRELRMRP